MKKMLKYSVIGIAFGAILFGAALVVFISTVDPNQYKDRIAGLVLEETGRTLTFDGDLDVFVFPRLGLSLGGLHLSNAASFGPKPMISVDSARVSVQTFPLFLGRVKFGKLELDGLVLNMGRDAQGRGNWDDLVGRNSSGQSEQEQPFSLEVEGVSITNGSLEWDDRMSDSRFILRGVTVSTGKIVEGALFPVDLALAFECLNPDAKGTVSLKGQSSIDLKNREYGHMDMHLALSASGKDIPGGKVDAQGSFKFLALNFNKEHAQVTGLDCTAYGATMHLDGTLEGITKGVKAVSGTVTLDPADIKKLLAALGGKPPVTADASALTQVGGTVVADFKPGHLEVKSLEADLDGTRIVGNGRVDRGESGPVYFARLDVGSLDLDRYLPPAHAGSATVSHDEAKAGIMDDTLLPVAQLKRLNLDLEAKAAELKLGGARFTKVVTVVDSGNGVVKIAPLSAEAYSGILELSATINVMGKRPETEYRVSVEKLNVGALSKDVGNKAEYAGIADFASSGTCQGKQARAMLQTLNGTLSFHLADGIFPGVDLARMARTTHTHKNKEGKVEASATDSTEFGSIAGTGTIKDGVVHNDDLDVKAPGLRAEGHGAVSLVTREIDYMVKAKLVPQAGGQGGKSSEDLFGVLVPIHVTGSLDHPYYWVSVKEYVKALGGVVIGTVGSVFSGVKSVVKGVGSVLDESCCEDAPGAGKSSKKSGFLGIF
ncbi:MULTISPECIES: AsmA family protein [unclassified Pseudodesulfovibrio]|uniref:AsmA family protein n=1 Tax=unclassified Pseudodesulfovibrio TaxID=2661612 RepID=UPI000FEBECF9|nr:MULTISPECIES: AsmA family protein [unclassified Pseudodesulfovibrio]MCJ2165923.1 AsmA family protein [Pseudodesulfovibrio sp. S3-i]RWU02646.1 AsmA family protein [Pseudodesulfovibrio sp. S3]